MEAKNLVIFLGGEQGAGKSDSGMFLADYLCQLEMKVPLRSIKFAGLLYEIKSLIEGDENQSASKEVLQDLGDVVRGRYGLDFMVKRTKEEIYRNLFQAGHMGKGAAIIVDDVRKELELDLADDLKKDGIQVISIYLDAPEAVRKARIAGHWRPNTKHNTETDLAHIKHKFDHIVSTAGSVAERNLMFISILASSGFLIDPKDDLSSTVGAFNQIFRQWEERFSMRANFRWDYDKEGRKILKVDDVSKYAPPQEAELKQHADAVGILMPTLEPFDGSKV